MSGRRFGQAVSNVREDKMIMKECTSCHRTMPVELFTKIRKNKSGYGAICKTCNAERCRGYRTRLGVILKERRKSWAYANLSHKEKRERNLPGSRAGNALYWHKKQGRVEEMPCVVCGATSHIHGHHEDYSKPLDVLWLCPKHHVGLHKLKGLSTDCGTKLGKGA